MKTLKEKRAQDSKRMRDKRARDKAKSLPTTRDIDKALRDGLRMVLVKMDARRLDDLREGGAVRMLIRLALDELLRAGGDRPAVQGRLLRRIGFFADAKRLG